MKLAALIALVTLAACSHSAKNPTEIVTPATNDDTSKAPIGQLIKAKATRVEFAENELANTISEYIAHNPKADYSDIGGFANKRLRDIGFAFDLISTDAEPQGSETLVKTIDGQYLNVGMFWEPLCAEGIAARYPVTEFKDNLWTIKYKNGTYQIRAKSLRIGEILRTNDQKKVSEVPIPEEGFEPGGITRNGKSIYAKLTLNAATNVWWRQQMRRDPREEPPFLVLLISSDRIEFSKNEEDLDAYEDKPQRHTEEDDTYQITYPESSYKFRSNVCT